MRIIRFNDLDFIAASHENPNDPGVVKKVLIQVNDLLPGRLQMINWAKLLPGKSFEAHFHEAMDEVFIIISGQVAITIGKETETLTEGDAVIIPQKEIHIMKNLLHNPSEYIALGISHESRGKTITV